jgi:hypothetical protein
MSFYIKPKTMPVVASRKLRKIALFFRLLSAFSDREFAPGFWRTCGQSELFGIASLVLMIALALAGVSQKTHLHPRPEPTTGAVYMFTLKHKVWYVDAVDLNMQVIFATGVIISVLRFLYACRSQLLRRYFLDFNFTFKNTITLVASIILMSGISEIAVGALARFLAQEVSYLPFDRVAAYLFATTMPTKGGTAWPLIQSRSPR